MTATARNAVSFHRQLSAVCAVLRCHGKPRPSSHSSCSTGCSLLHHMLAFAVQPCCRCGAVRCSLPATCLARLRRSCSLQQSAWLAGMSLPTSSNIIAGTTAGQQPKQAAAAGARSWRSPAGAAAAGAAAAGASTGVATAGAAMFSACTFNPCTHGSRRTQQRQRSAPHTPRSRCCLPCGGRPGGRHLPRRPAARRRCPGHLQAMLVRLGGPPGRLRWARGHSAPPLACRRPSRSPRGELGVRALLFLVGRVPFLFFEPGQAGRGGAQLALCGK